LSAKLRAFGAAAALVALADQGLKAWIVTSLEPYGRLPLLGSVVTLMRLPSAATGWGPFEQLPVPVLAGLMLGAVALLAGLLLRAGASDRFTGAALGLIAGAGLASAVDRFYVGNVLDIVAIDFGRFALPPFNLGDAAIMLGTALLLLDIAASDASHAAAVGAAEPPPVPDVASEVEPREP
jgi:lipoprotein signal peptidase